MAFIVYNTDILSVAVAVVDPFDFIANTTAPVILFSEGPMVVTSVVFVSKTSVIIVAAVFVDVLSIMAAALFIHLAGSLAAGYVVYVVCIMAASVVYALGIMVIMDAGFDAFVAVIGTEAIFV